MSGIKYPKLPKKFKEKWLEALRSGKYRSTTGTLCKLNKSGEKALGYCCLGVAASISGVLDTNLNYGVIIDDSITKSAKKIIPKIIQGSVGENEVVAKLVTMNDTGKAGFKRIANWIEKNL